MTAHAPIQTDALVIGAGPAGLWQVFQLGLQGISAHVVDALPHVGGQLAELYPDKPIYDIPGLPVCTGRELVQRLSQQIAPFAPTLHLGQAVDALQRLDDGRWSLRAGASLHLVARTVFIAAGVGAFQPKRLRLDGIEDLEGSQVHYRVDEPAVLAGQSVVVHGGDDLAIDWVLRLLDAPQAPARIGLLHRRAALQSDDAAALARVHAAIEDGRIELIVGQPTALVREGARLTALELLSPDGSQRILPVEHLVVALGLSPRLGPIAEWGLAMERKQLVVNPETFATRESGLFAVGDINTYPGKKKLILCGFHEATLAAFAAAALLHPDEPIPLQYTTTSPRLHKLLGVSSR